MSKNGAPAGPGWLAFGAGLLAGVWLTVAAGEKLGLASVVPHSRGLRRGLSAFYSAGQVDDKMRSLSGCYRMLLQSTPPRSDPALQKHIRELILPTLALYRVLQQELETAEAARQRVQQVVEAAYGPRSQAPMRLLDRLPNPYPLFRKALHWRMAADFPDKGFRTEWVQDDERGVAFNLHTCLYLDVLRLHKAEELTPVFCHLDDVMMQDVGFVRWDRTQTQGLGAAYCDFRWTRQR